MKDEKRLREMQLKTKTKKQNMPKKNLVVSKQIGAKKAVGYQKSTIASSRGKQKCSRAVNCFGDTAMLSRVELSRKKIFYLPSSSKGNCAPGLEKETKRNVCKNIIKSRKNNEIKNNKIGNIPSSRGKQDGIKNANCSSNTKTPFHVDLCHKKILPLADLHEKDSLVKAQKRNVSPRISPRGEKETGFNVASRVTDEGGQNSSAAGRLNLLGLSGSSIISQDLSKELSNFIERENREIDCIKVETQEMPTGPYVISFSNFQHYMYLVDQLNSTATPHSSMFPSCLRKYSSKFPKILNKPSGFLAPF